VRPAGVANFSIDGCSITAELQKKKHIYYRCSFGKGRHKVPYLPESKLAEMLGESITQIQISAEVADSILAALEAERLATISLDSFEEFGQILGINPAKFLTVCDLRKSAGRVSLIGLLFM